MLNYKHLLHLRTYTHTLTHISSSYTKSATTNEIYVKSYHRKPNFSIIVLIIAELQTLVTLTDIQPHRQTHISSSNTKSAITNEIYVKSYPCKPNFKMIVHIVAELQTLVTFTDIHPHRQTRISSSYTKSVITSEIYVKSYPRKPNFRIIVQIVAELQTLVTFTDIHPHRQTFLMLYMCCGHKCIFLHWSLKYTATVANHQVAPALYYFISFL